MSVYKRGNTWWVNFTFAGKRIQESAKTTRKTIAKDYERERRRQLERAYAGIPIDDPAKRLRSVSEVVAAYLKRYHVNHRQQSRLFAKYRLANVKRLLGPTLLPDLSEDAIFEYIDTRLNEGVSGRTINAELGELSRAIGQPWSRLWPKIARLEERHDVGRALSEDEERRIIRAAGESTSPIVGTIIRIALLTAMRIGEIMSLRWEQVNLADRFIRVGRAKTESGTGRDIPMNDDLCRVLATHAEWFRQRFGETAPDLYLFPFGKPMPSDPTKHITTLKTAWKTIRARSGVKCRIHDLRHTVLTKMAEGGTPESTMKALAGHMSRAMLERYSHIRMKAKRVAMDSVRLPDSKRVSTESTTSTEPATIQ